MDTRACMPWRRSHVLYGARLDEESQNCLTKLKWRLSLLISDLCVEKVGSVPVAIHSFHECVCKH